MKATDVIRHAPEGTFVHVNRLPGSVEAARQAASRAARKGELLPVRRGVYYRGAKTRYGMAPPQLEEVAKEVLGEMGVGPAGYSAAREWGLTTQMPAAFHVATLWPTDPIDGIVQHSRKNRERALLNAKEIALLELLRAPEVYVEAGWSPLVRKVREALDRGHIREGSLGSAVAAERNRVVRGNYARLISDLGAR